MFGKCCVPAEEYDKRDTYIVDEMGLFFKLHSEQSRATKGKSCYGRRRSKVRLTVVCAVNMNNSANCDVFVIRRLKKPHCSKAVQRLQVEYLANGMARVTTELFEQWVIDLSYNK